VAHLTRIVARLNRVGLNRLTKLIFPWLPGFGVVVHRGRRSGRTYRTPVNVFRTPHGYVIALTYGRSADWVQNVTAAGGCELVTRGRRLPVIAPRVFADDHRRDIRPVERQVLRLFGVRDFLELQPRPGAEHPGAR
jgi:deazaflavin-dependent oxidoreductase (nitroreductase family)